jgi:hypothetical protein
VNGLDDVGPRDGEEVVVALDVFMPAGFIFRSTVFGTAAVFPQPGCVGF